jgi:Domain of unknown function (DUF305)
MKLFNHNSTMFMVICMFFAGFASTMNMWVDNWGDIRFSLNDLYMTGLMTGWMFFFMGLFTGHTMKCLGGLVVATGFFLAIRGQWFIDENEYLRGMIPHHSMAIMMSKRLRERPNNIRVFLDRIIKGQSDEIKEMKMILNSS